MTETMQEKVACETQAALVRADIRQAILDNMTHTELYREIFTEWPPQWTEEDLLDFIEEHMPDTWDRLVTKWGR